ncbi:MAG: hypothetical protein KGZ58_03110 [Ignavibacteriales bacterium]|nr:hypothetical protein [Ignavibacteriales bacterium]
MLLYKFVLRVLCCLALPFPLFAQQDSLATSDSLLIKQLEQEMLKQTETTQTLSSQTQSRSGISTNPDMSVIGDFRTAYTGIGKRKIETYLNEVEFQIVSVVDPYARAEFLFSFGKDLTTGDHEIELEVGTLTSLSLPYQLQVTLGKFKPVFGKVNTLHPHYFDFVEFPQTINNFFDAEGMFMEGISASWLVSNPFDFYQELVLEIGRAGSQPNASFVQGGNDNLLYSSHLKNFFDLSDNSTFEFGISGMTGPNAFGFISAIGGIDVTYKWKPIQFNTYHSFIWQTEAMISNVRDTINSNIQSYGFYSLMEYQIEKRLFLGSKFDYAEFPGINNQYDKVTSLLLRLQPTEFQILALELRNIQRNYASDYNQILLRFIFGIGTHGAHTY